MSAKVIKARQPMQFVPFAVPAMDGIGEPARGQVPFVVPAFDPASVVDEPQPFEPVPLLTTPEDLLDDARREAARIIAEAEQSRSLMEQAAFEKAQAEAMASFEAELNARMVEVRSELAGSLEKLALLSNDISSHAESELVELALQIAKKVVRREVTIDREIALTLVRVSLAKLNQRTTAEVHLNPEDLSYIKSRLDSLDFRGAVDLVEDASISHGGCLIHTETGDVDARIESQFDEIAFGLLN